MRLFLIRRKSIFIRRTLARIPHFRSNLNRDGLRVFVHLPQYKVSPLLLDHNSCGVKLHNLFGHTFRSFPISLYKVNAEVLALLHIVKVPLLGSRVLGRCWGRLVPHWIHVSRDQPRSVRYVIAVVPMLCRGRVMILPFASWSIEWVFICLDVKFAGNLLIFLLFGFLPMLSLCTWLFLAFLLN